jgi:diadenosine tetraphosphate (Ap4A) HIT family hydrolase
MPLVSDCLICSQEPVDRALSVFEDDQWAAGVLAGYEVPGWVILRVRRHALGLAGLSSGELTTFARRARDLVEAVKDVTGAPVAYLMVFGESNPHFHALIAPRAEDVALDRRTGEILRLRHEKSDVETARALVPALRAAYLRRARDLAAGTT